MPWLVVKFVETDEVEALPLNWYNKTKGTVLYPSFIRGQLEKAIRNEMEPDDTWKPYKVQLLRPQPYDNFNIACSKASKACITSDISDIEVVLPKKRIPKKKYISSDEDDFSSDKSLENVPLPPSSKKSGLNRKMVMNENTRVLVRTRESKSIVDLHASDDEYNADNVQDFHETCADEYAHGTTQDKYDAPNVQDVNNTRHIDDTKFKEQVITYLVKQNKVLRDLETKCDSLYWTLEDIKLTITAISEGRSKGEKVNDPAENDIFKKCPVKTIEEFEEFEKNLQDESTFNLLVKNLSRLGGTNYKECTRRCLSKLIDDTVAQTYSQHGHKGKKSFCKVRMCSVLCDAVQLCNEKVTKKDIEIVSAQWLAKASIRLRAKNQHNDNADPASIDTEN